MKKLIQGFLKRYGYKIHSLKDTVMDSDPLFNRIYNLCHPYTMTTRERMFSLYSAVKYIVKNDIPGDFVECGVWKGGSSMVMAATLNALGAKRKLWLYDVFEDENQPTEEDWFPGFFHDEHVGRTEDEVRENMLYVPYKYFELVKGKVEDTIPANVPDKIAILRLDTDWYVSTKHELNHLYPLLVKGGVLIIDDYALVGARKAVDEYFQGSVLLNRIDHDSRIVMKP